MLLIAGCDPGATGAISIYDRDADKLVCVWDLPNFKIPIGTKTRTRMDSVDLEAMFDCMVSMGVRLFGIENVQGGNWGGRKQGAVGAFQFGYVFGALNMLAQVKRIPVAAASPAVWKLTEKVPKDETGIILKADKEFPEHTERFHGPKGGKKHDRAESAFLSRYFARKIWPSMQPAEGLRTLAKGLGKRVMA